MKLSQTHHVTQGGTVKRNPVNLAMGTVYSFHSDAGHGWVKVPKRELKQLGIFDKITPYSYQKGDFAYLEEDNDATLFVNARLAMGYPRPEWNEIDDGDSSPIRNYAPFGE